MTPVWVCEECDGDSGVYDSRTSPKGYILRQRKCLKCDARWSTYEVRSEGDLSTLRNKLADVSRELSEAFALLSMVSPKPTTRRRRSAPPQI